MSQSIAYGRSKSQVYVCGFLVGSYMPKVAKQLTDLRVRSLKTDGVIAVGGVLEELFMEDSRLPVFPNESGCGVKVTVVKIHVSCRAIYSCPP